MRASLPSRRAGRIGGVGHVENFLLVRTSDRTVSDYIKRMVANASAGDGRPVLEIARETLLGMEALARDLEDALAEAKAT